MWMMIIIVPLNGGCEVQINSTKEPSTLLVKGCTLDTFHLFLLLTKMAHRNPNALEENNLFTYLNKWSLYLDNWLYCFQWADQLFGKESSQRW